VNKFRDESISLLSFGSTPTQQEDQNRADQRGHFEDGSEGNEAPCAIESDPKRECLDLGVEVLVFDHLRGLGDVETLSAHSDEDSVSR
jgi:hypothetical protein